MKRTHAKRIATPSHSAKELSGRSKQTSITGGKRKKPKTTTTNNPATTQTITTIPPLPPEISDNKTGRIYWKKYWSYLISRNQAVPDFIPTITTLCMLRVQYNRLYVALDSTGPLTRNAITGQKNLITMSRNITALEAENGLTLTTHSISQTYSPTRTKEDEIPAAINVLANRNTADNPYTIPDSDLFDAEET